MNKDGKIYITISDERGNGGNGIEGTQTIENPLKWDEEPFVDVWASTQLLSTISNVITRDFKYKLSNVGNFTGMDYVQEDINNALSVMNTLMGIASTAIAGGIKYGGIGAVVGLSLGLINAASSNYYDKTSQIVRNNRINYEIAQLRDRSGLNVLLDGSRGTEN